MKEKQDKGKWGGYRPGSGRPPMSGNLVTQSYREAFAKAIELMEAGPNNLAAWAQDNPTAFWTIASRLLPISMQADVTSGGEPLRLIEVTFVDGPGQGEISSASAALLTGGQALAKLDDSQMLEWEQV